jgi:hypothetical protein
LIEIKALPPPETDQGDGKTAFFGLAAHLMRRLLIHHARPPYSASSVVTALAR